MNLVRSGKGTVRQSTSPQPPPPTTTTQEAQQTIGATPQEATPTEQSPCAATDAVTPERREPVRSGKGTVRQSTSPQPPPPTTTTQEAQQTIGATPQEATPTEQSPVPPPMPSPRSGVNLFDQARERFGNQPVRNRRRRQRPLKKLNRPSEQPRKKLPPPNNPPVPPPMPSPRSGVNLFDQARERFGNQSVRNRRRRQRPLKKLNRPSEQPRKKLPPPNNPPVPPPMPSPRSGVNLFDQARERFG